MYRNSILKVDLRTYKMHFNAKLVWTLLILTITTVVSDDNDENYTLTKEGDFLWLTKNNIKQLLNHDRVMVIFYTHRAEICSQCKEAEKTVAKMIPEYGTDFPGHPNFFLVNCDHDSAICEKRLRHRKLPTLEIRIGKKDIYYHGDFSLESVQDFLNPKLTNRLEKYDSQKFTQMREQQHNDKHVIAVFKTSESQGLLRPIENLMRLEFKDHFIHCDGNIECLLLFVKDPDSNLLLLKKNAREFLKVSHEMSFIELVADFNHFKNPLFIPFGLEFERSVMQEMRPTLIYIVDSDREGLEHSIEVFKAQARLHVKYLHACIIKKHHLSEKQMKLFNRFAEMISIDHYTLPLVLMVEQNPQTKQLIKYYFLMSQFNSIDLYNYIDAWRHRLLKPTPRNQNKHPHYIEDMRMISHDDFDLRVFVKGKESVLLVHTGFEESQISRQFLNLQKEASKQRKYEKISFMVIDGVKNDLPVEIERMPCFLIFAENVWNHPLQFSKPTATLEELMRIIDNRSELIALHKPPIEFDQDL
jgi:hypothetical protein